MRRFNRQPGQNTSRASAWLTLWAVGSAMAVGLGMRVTQAAAQPATESTEARPPQDDQDLRRWLANMADDHQFTVAEMSQALGMSEPQVEAALSRFGLPSNARAAALGSERAMSLKLLPYPGGRHPRLGFLEGAVHPQRETKLSVFPPWADGGYAVIDVPEAVWFRPGGERQLLYLAHTHVPTIWDRQGVTLPRLEWGEAADGWLAVARTLPNGVTFTSRAHSGQDGVRLEFAIENGSDAALSGLDVQMCVMLGRLRGFQAATNDNKQFGPVFAAAHDQSGRRWIITGWQRAARVWGNAPCPCLHSDPRLEDCPVGGASRVRGWVSFYEGTEIEAHLAQLASLAWTEPAPP